MKLREYNSENTVSIRGGGVKTPSLSINQKAGLFSLNKEACALIGLTNEDKVIILQDEEETENWYLEKVKGNGFILREKENVSSGLLFNNTALVRSIAASVNFTDNGGRMLIAGSPTDLGKRKLWGLLTTGLRNK
ncbi:MAG: hypothetical protein WKF88_05640 [Ferruginibacter sp.]